MTSFLIRLKFSYNRYKLIPVKKETTETTIILTDDLDPESVEYVPVGRIKKPGLF